MAETSDTQTYLVVQSTGCSTVECTAWPILHTQLLICIQCFSHFKQMLKANHCPIELKIFLLKIFALFHASFFESFPHLVTAQSLCGNCTKILYVLVNLTSICKTNLFRICKFKGETFSCSLFFLTLMMITIPLHKSQQSCGSCRDIRVKLPI